MLIFFMHFCCCRAVKQGRAARRRHLQYKHTHAHTPGGLAACSWTQYQTHPCPPFLTKPHPPSYNPWPTPPPPSQARAVRQLHASSNLGGFLYAIQRQKPRGYYSFQQIIVKIILHSICVLNHAKVYVQQNIFHKKSQYMIFHVL